MNGVSIPTDDTLARRRRVLAPTSPVTGQAVGSNVFTVAAPIGGSSATEFGARVRQCIEKMRSAGIEPAALLVDTIFGSDGVASHPAGFLAEAVDTIHAAGGLFIADEVQP